MKMKSIEFKLEMVEELASKIKVLDEDFIEFQSKLGVLETDLESESRSWEV